MKQFKDHLVEILNEKGETISSVSKATGLPASTLSEWCNGRRPVLDVSILQLARYLGVSVERLISGAEPTSELINELLRDDKENLIEIHSGVYRVRIERVAAKPSKSKK